MSLNCLILLKWEWFITLFDFFLQLYFPLRKLVFDCLLYVMVNQTKMSSLTANDDCLAWAARDPSGVLSPYNFSRRSFFLFLLFFIFSMRHQSIFYNAFGCGFYLKSLFAKLIKLQLQFDLKKVRLKENIQKQIKLNGEWVISYF